MLLAVAECQSALGQFASFRVTKQTVVGPFLRKAALGQTDYKQMRHAEVSHLLDIEDSHAASRIGRAGDRLAAE